MNMAKNQTNQKPATIDWNAEAKIAEKAAKEKGGSRGDMLQRCMKSVMGESPAGKLLRESAGAAGAQAFIESPRNVLAKLPKLAGCIAAGTAWCSESALLPENRRKEDASVAVALVAHGAGNSRQKEIVAHALTRYPGGANAQMPAAMEALAFFGIVARKAGGKRNADYEIVDRARADALIPHA
jgi:hypothetical protein